MIHPGVRFYQRYLSVAGEIFDLALDGDLAPLSSPVATTCMRFFNP